ncbi:MAG: hypothetical protein Q7S47_01900 [bacterium]|nr:hypothetical protein [bacterium]
MTQQLRDFFLVSTDGEPNKSDACADARHEALAESLKALGLESYALLMPQPEFLVPCLVVYRAVAKLVGQTTDIITTLSVDNILASEGGTELSRELLYQSRMAGLVKGQQSDVAILFPHGEPLHVLRGLGVADVEQFGPLQPLHLFHGQLTTEGQLINTVSFGVQSKEAVPSR